MTNMSTSASTQISSQRRLRAVVQMDRWKPNILELRRKGKRLEEIMQIMSDDHQFTAPKWQYEGALRQWGSRRNLTRPEWTTVIQILLVLREERPHDLFMDGSKVEELKVQRNKRRYKIGNAPELRNTPSGQLLAKLPEGVTIRPSEDSQTQAQQVTVDEGPEPPGTPEVSAPTVDIPIPAGEPAFFGEGWAVPDVSLLQVGFNINPVGIQPIASPLSQSLHGDLLSLGVGSPPDTFFGNMATLARDANWTDGVEPFDVDTNAEPMDPQALFFSNSTSALPSHSRWEATGLINQDLVGQSEYLTLGKLLVREAFFAAPTRSLPSVEVLLERLQSLQSTGPGEGNLLYKHDHGLFTDRFFRWLLFSVANNLAGLEDIPLKAIMKCIADQSHMRSHFLKCFQDPSSLYSSAVAETVFRAAIEARESTTVQLLLGSSLVNPNAVVCWDGESPSRVTPVERAARLGDLNTCRCLLEAGADANKSYDDVRYRSLAGALEHAVGTFWCSRSAADMELVTLLLENGAEVSVSSLLSAILLGHEQLVTVLSKRVPLEYPCPWFASYGSYSNCPKSPAVLVAQILRNEPSSLLIGHWLTQCQIHHNSRCCVSDTMDEVLAPAARRANLELVKKLVSFVSQHGLNRALCAAARSGDRPVVHLLLQEGARIGAAPSRACELDENSDRIKIGFDCPTTPLAEAIRINSDELIQLFEQEAFPKANRGTGRREAAVRAIAETGNIQHFLRLRQTIPDLGSGTIDHGFDAAVKAQHEELALYLLALGARVTDLLLNSAIMARNERLVSAMLHAESHRIPFRGAMLLLPAVVWGNLSLLEDLVTLCSTQAVYPAKGHAAALRYAIEKRNQPMVDVLLKLPTGPVLNTLVPCSHDCLHPPSPYKTPPTPCACRGSVTPFGASVAAGDEELVNLLLKEGADVADESAFLQAMANNATLLRNLFQVFRRQYPLGKPGFGATVLRYALRKQDSGTLLDLCLSARFDVDAFSAAQWNRHHRLEPVEHGRPCSYTNSLGYAIRVYKGHDRVELVGKLLTDTRADINSPVSKRCRGYPSCLWNAQSALLEAIETRDANLVEFCIQRGADIHKQAKLGLRRTPLQKACEMGSYPAVDLLLRYGAEVNEKPTIRGGGTALQLAAKGGFVKIAERLLNSGASLYAAPSQVDGHTAIEFSAKHGRLHMIGFLWNASIATGEPFSPEHLESARKLAEEWGHMACALRLRTLSCNAQGLLDLDAM